MVTTSSRKQASLAQRHDRGNNRGYASVTALYLDW
jgi:hypothetical protein